MINYNELLEKNGWIKTTIENVEFNKFFILDRNFCKKITKKNKNFFIIWKVIDKKVAQQSFDLTDIDQNMEVYVRIRN